MADHPAPQSDDSRLENALSVYLRWRETGQPATAEELLAQHGSLRDLLEPMISDGESDADAPSDERRLGDFTLLREIGRGGMGVVYEARQVSLGRRVALKVLPAHLTLQATAIARFRREAETAARLSHSGLVAVHTVAREGDVHFFAMDFVDGAPLDEVVRQLAGRDPEGLSGQTVAEVVVAACHRPVETDAVAGPAVLEGIDLWSGSYVRAMVGIAVQVADALAHAHADGVLHRDVKPSNILVRPDGTAVLTDFGLARQADLPSVTLTGEFAGTPYYVSPEQAMSGRAPVDRRADIFSLGATLYELLTLERPFPGDTQQEVLGRIIAREPRDPQRLNPHLATDLAAIVLKALEKDPDRRYATASAMADDLRAFLDYRPVAARRVGGGTRLVRWARRNPVVSGLAAALLVVLLGAAVWTLVVNRQLRVALTDMRRMSDVRLVQTMGEYVQHLQASRPAHAQQLQTWLEQARALVGRRPAHEATLAALRARTAAPEVGAAYQFDDWTDQWQHDTLVELLTLLDEFSASPGPVETVERWVQHVRQLEQNTLRDPAALWERTIAAIAEHPRYGGLQLRPQIGLVPLGADPRSGLHEFAHLLTGEVPERGADGELVLTPETGLVFVLIPGGTATMGAAKPSEAQPRGSPHVDPWTSSSEMPVHRLELAPFFVSKLEATHGQWLRGTGKKRGSLPERDMVPPGFSKLVMPVETLSWVEADEGLRAMGLCFPTDAQWEYAARGGTTSIWYCGDTVDALLGHANFSDRGFMRVRGQRESADPERWKFDDGWGIAAPVGLLEPNPFGLHDIHGNVSEWVQDTPVMYSEPAREGDGLRTGGNPGFHLTRGGSYSTLAIETRCASRARADKWTHIAMLGLRPARAVDR